MLTRMIPLIALSLLAPALMAQREARPLARNVVLPHQ